MRKEYGQKNSDKKEELMSRKRRIEERNKYLKKKRSELDKRVPLDDSRRNIDFDEYGRVIDVEYSKKNNKSNNIPKKKKKKSKKKNDSKKALSITLKMMGIVILIFFAFIGTNVASSISNIGNKEMIKPKIVDMDETVNILLLGMDVGNIKNPNDKSSKRTDTMMVVNFNPKTKKVNVISIPRDTLIQIDGRRWKMNAAYPIGGESLVASEIEKLLDININYVANINYKAFRDIIDAIGGVKVEIKHDMDYTDKSQNLRIKFKKGTVENLDGKKAEEFFRWRKNNNGTGLANGDLGRIENQQEFMKAFIDKFKNPSIIFKIPNILKAIEENIDTNMPGNRIFRYGLKFMSVKASDFKMTTIKGTPQMIDGQSYVVFNKGENMNLIKSLKGDSNKSYDFSDKKLLILNGTSITGLASNYKEKASNLKFKLIDVGNAKNPNESYIMTNDKDIKKKLMDTFKSITDYKELNTSEYKEYDVVIVLGDDANFN